MLNEEGLSKRKRLENEFAINTAIVNASQLSL